MQTILITGGAGFVGTNLAEALLNDGYKVISVDNFQTGYQKNIDIFSDNPNYKFIKADVNKYDEIAPIMLSQDIDYVFHYAACVGVQYTLNNPLKVLDDVDGFKNILNLSKSIGIKRIFFSSSSEVYGGYRDEAQNEEKTPLNSRLPYAVIKNVGESFIKTYHKEHGLNYTIFRFFNTYGQFQSPNYVMSRFILQALEGKNITLYGDGSNSRCFLHISDNIKATMNALKSEEFKNNTYNLGSNFEFSTKQLAAIVKELTGSESKIVNLPDLKEGDMKKRFPDISKMQVLHPESDFKSFENGVMETIEWYKNDLKNNNE